MFAGLFLLRGQLSRKRELTLAAACGGGVLLLWWFVAYFNIVSRGILPPPEQVLIAFYDLHFKDGLVRNLFVSLKLNVLGYIEAIALSLPLGFLIGLFPFFRGMFERYIAVVRYLPLTAAMGLFIAWFGIDVNMKVQFLSFSIFVYLLPVVAQRVSEVQQVYVDTVKTVGASQFQTITSVFIPDVISRVFDDIGVLIPLSWTYIIITEVVNSSAGGIGALAYIAARQSRVDKVFAILVVIMCVGFLQDWLKQKADRLLFPHKYA